MTGVEVQIYIISVMFTLFVDGGLLYMTVLTVLLVAIFLAAWKAPRWIKEIGLFALVFGLLRFVLFLRQLFSVLQEVADQQTEEIQTVFDIISPGGLFGGLKVALIPAIYGIIIYLVSLVARLIHKPRL